MTKSLIMQYYCKTLTGNQSDISFTLLTIKHVILVKLFAIDLSRSRSGSSTFKKVFGKKKSLKIRKGVCLR